MLPSSRAFGSRQSVWPAKLVALSVATCPVNALAHVYRLSLSCTVPSSESFSHTSPVFRSVTVPSPLSAYASGAPLRSSPSWPVPAQEMTAPLLFQHVVCPVAGSRQAVMSVVVAGVLLLVVEVLAVVVVEVLAVVVVEVLAVVVVEVLAVVVVVGGADVVVLPPPAGG